GAGGLFRTSGRTGLPALEAAADVGAAAGFDDPEHAGTSTIASDSGASTRKARMSVPPGHDSEDVGETIDLLFTMTQTPISAARGPFSPRYRRTGASARRPYPGCVPTRPVASRD